MAEACTCSVQIKKREKESFLFLDGIFLWFVTICWIICLLMPIELIVCFFLVWYFGLLAIAHLCNLEKLALSFFLQVTKDFDGSAASMHKESHSMYRALPVDTSGCNQQNFLDQIFVPLSIAFPFVPHKQRYEHLSDTQTIGLYSRIQHWVLVLVKYCELCPWLQD